LRDSGAVYKCTDYYYYYYYATMRRYTLWWLSTRHLVHTVTYILP